MSNMILYIASTLDGFIADSQGSVKWLEPFESEDYGYEKFFDSIGILIMGSKTYRQVLTFGEWPYKGKTTWVLTSQPENHQPDSNVEFSSEEPKNLIKRIKNTSKKDIWLVGGGQVISSFINQNLIETIILFIMPILLGNGIRLFDQIRKPRSLRLLEEKVYKNGVIELHYEIANQTIADFDN